MERPRSTTKSHHSCSPSSVPTPLSITASQGIRRSHLTPTSALLDGELSLSRIERLSPNQQQRTPTVETGTPRLVAAVSEAKRAGAAAPSPINDVPMDRFDKMLNRLAATPSQTPPTAREDTNSPGMVTRAVHNVVVDETKRRELMLSLQRLLQDAKVLPHFAATGSSSTPRTPTPSAGHKVSRNNTPPAPSVGASGSDASVLTSIGTIARIVHNVSPLQLTVQPQHCAASSTNADGSTRGYERDTNVAAPAPFVHQTRRGICRPQPQPTALSHMSKERIEQALGMRSPQTSQRIIKSERSAFSETTENSSLTSYSTTKSAKVAKKV